MMRRITIGDIHRMRLPILLLALSASTLHAASPDRTAALAAGYKAAFLCSGIFTAGQGESQVAADDLTGIYPDYQAQVSALPAVVDQTAKTVSVAFDPALPPRIAAWRPNLGCTQLPVGAPATTTETLPRFDATPPDFTRTAWPTGDVGALAPLRKLEPLLAAALDGQSYGPGARTTAVVVVHRGRIVGERYRDGYGITVPQRTWSVAKSLTATLVGRASKLGLLDPEAPAPVPEWQADGDPRAAITMMQLLHMNSGLWTDGPGNRSDGIYLGGDSVEARAAAMPLETAPGTRFNYANNDTLFAARALRWTLGDGSRATEFPFRDLLWRIGMTRTTPEVDWTGNFVLSSQVWTTARDLARLGMLYLANGKWGGEQLLPPGWTARVTAPAPAQPPAAFGRRYGAQFWLMGGVAGLPADTYAMLGNRGQSVIIVPSRDAVIVRRGFDNAGKAGFEDAKFARAVLDALN
jgi:CubicO group peptidase (beta-lactamase class C family)